MESHAKILGHPAHPILVAFPLGLLATSLVFDGAGAKLDRPELMTTGYWMAASGVVMGLVSAVPGLIDYLAIPSATRAKKIGLLHGLGNVAVLALFGGSLASRTPETHGASATSLALSASAVLLALGTGWLGGELVDRLGVGVDDGAHINSPNSLTHKSAAVNKL